VRINGEKARIGLTTKHNAPVLLSRFLKSPFLRHRIRERGTITSKIVPLGTVRRTFSDRLLLIGEAAGLMKTTTHGGIYYGLISSECAVRTLQKAFKERDFGKNTMSSYENLWKKHFDREIRSGLLIRKVFSQMRDGHIDGLFKIAMSDGVMDLVYKKARFDWHSDVIFSLFRHSLVGNMFRGLLPFAQHSRNN
jgi:flavin-dependent dehydrogenase